MNDTIDKQQVKADLEEMAKHLRMATILINKVYDRMNEIYKEVTK